MNLRADRPRPIGWLIKPATLARVNATVQRRPTRPQTNKSSSGDASGEVQFSSWVMNANDFAGRFAQSCEPANRSAPCQVMTSSSPIVASLRPLLMG
jgi:hypothetical protein